MHATVGRAHHHCAPMAWRLDICMAMRGRGRGRVGLASLSHHLLPPVLTAHLVSPPRPRNPNARTLTSLNRLVCFLNTSLSHDLSTLASHFRVGGIRPGKTSGAEVAGRWLLQKQGRCSAGRSAASLAFAGGWVGGRAPLTPPISSVALSTSVHATRLCSIAPAFCTSVLHASVAAACCICCVV